jgi:hypothetical protein
MGGSNTGGSARDNGGPAMAARPSVQGGGARGLAEAGVGGWGGGVGGARGLIGYGVAVAVARKCPPTCFGFGSWAKRPR